MCGLVFLVLIQNVCCVFGCKTANFEQKRAKLA